MLKRTKILRQACALLAHTAPVSVLAIAFALFAYAHPLADDFWRAGKVLDSGVLASVVREYFEWSGRWAAAAIEFSVSSVFDLTNSYGLLLAFIALIYVLALFTFFATLFKGDLPRRALLFLIASVFALYWVGMPSTGQPFYWFTGSVENQLSIAGMLFLFTGLLRFRATHRLGVCAQILALCLLALFTTGMHELYGLIMCIILGVSTIIAFKLQCSNRVVYAVVFMATLLGFFLVFAAPGNEVRISDLSQRGLYASPSLAVALTIKQGFFSAIRWVLDVRLLSATLFFVMSPWFREIRPSWLFRRNVNWKLVVLVTWFAVLAVAFFGPSWAMGQKMPSRTLSAIYMLFLLGWIVTVFLFTRWPVNRHPNRDVASKAIRAAALGVFAFSLIVTGNTTGAVLDLVWNRAIGYDRAMRQRYKHIHSEIENGKPDVRVPALSARPKTMWATADITSNPDDWTNQCVAHFFRLKSIAVEP